MNKLAESRRKALQREYFENPERIIIHDDAWDDASATDDDLPIGTRLLAPIIVNGIRLHVEAYEVKTDGGVQEIADPNFQAEWEAACTFNQNSAFETVTIRGREYVLIATPYGT
jgi:hypothetical protein